MSATEAVPATPIEIPTDGLSLEENERSLLAKALEKTNGNQTQAARLLRMDGQVGTVAPGAYADLLVVDGNPLDDVALLAHPHDSVVLIVRAGDVVVQRLEA